MIEIDDLHKAYGDLAVLRGVDLRVGAGEVVGLLGPNGAGKSTLLHLILGFLKPDRGQIRVFGSSDLEHVRTRIGYVPERQRYHTHLSPREYLRFLGAISGLSGPALHERIDAELAAVGLGDAADRRLGAFSKGMLQRVGIAQALLADPDLLIIDEPTSGLDPSGQREVIELLAEVRSRGHAILLCTHYLHEVDLLCDRVGVLTRGQIVAEASVADLRGPGGSVSIHTGQLVLELRRQIEALDPAIRCDRFGVRISPNSHALQATVLRVLLDANIEIVAVEPLESPLEQLYLQAVRGEVRPEPLPTTGAAPELPLGLPPIATSIDMTPPSREPAAKVSEPAKKPAPAAPAPRIGEGDTLLNELLRRNTEKDGD
jgi:ABC-2 type transport system ATP-binding protein